MKENSIEETIKQLKLMLKVRKEQKEIIECTGGSCMNCNPDIRALTESIDILSDYKRVLKENEELLEVKVSASAHNRILELEKENEELKAEMKDGVIGIKLYALQKENEKLKKKIDLMENYMVENGWEICFDNIYAELNNCNGMERDWCRGDKLEKQDIHKYFSKKLLESEK